jgi:hypothetical protein
VAQENAPQGDESSGNATATDFPQFMKLPLEIRLKIWGYAPPEPMTVLQRVSKFNKSRFTYHRKPPAVLHACRESRLEYLDTDEGSDSASIARRRKEHPVYKLFFQNRGLRGTLAYFSVDMDTFYGREYEGKVTKKTPHYAMSRTWGGILELEIAKSLKHLTIKEPWYMTASYFRQGFPKLEVLTILLELSKYWEYSVLPGGAGVTRQFLVPPPEINEQMDIDGMSQYYRTRLGDYKKRNQREFDLEKKDHPEWTPPIFRLRFDEQFLANANFSP